MFQTAHILRFVYMFSTCLLLEIIKLVDVVPKLGALDLSLGVTDPLLQAQVLPSGRSLRLIFI